jgi:hypothetical protein
MHRLVVRIFRDSARGTRISTLSFRCSREKRQKKLTCHKTGNLRPIEGLLPYLWRPVRCRLRASEITRGKEARDGEACMEAQKEAGWRILNCAREGKMEIRAFSLGSPRVSQAPATVSAGAAHHPAEEKGHTLPCSIGRSLSGPGETTPGGDADCYF